MTSARMSNPDLLTDTENFAALIAPIIDRTAISVHNAVSRDEVAALRGEHRFHPNALALFAGPLASGPISKLEFDELTRYQHFGSTDAFVAGLAERGAITVDVDGSLRPTDDGKAVSRMLVSLQAATVTALYSPRSASLPELRDIMVLARSAAVADPLSLLAKYCDRSWLPHGASDAAVIWDASVVLRMHRSDAHALAWKEAGRTVKEIRAMEPGPARDAIEQRTNELAATPWRGLSAEQRLWLLAGLGALPGTGSPI